MKTHNYWVLLVLIAWIFPGASLAGNCSINVQGVAFGSYNPFNTAASNDVGTVVASCSGRGTLRVSLSTGQSGSYTMRYMVSATTSDQLDYNLYMNASRTRIFGDGTGGTRTVSRRYRNQTVDISIYGQIPALQNVASGNYLDSIVATITF